MSQTEEEDHLNESSDSSSEDDNYNSGSDSENEDGSRIKEEGNVWTYFHKKHADGEEDNPNHRVQLSETDKSPAIRVVGDDKLVCEIGMKGYCMIRATHGLETGSYYFEVTMNKVDKATYQPKADYTEPHARVGWSLSQGELDAPVGFDKYSYAYRDVTGQVFHQSKGKNYGKPYGPGDVIGAYIYIPDRTKSKPDLKEKRENYTDETGQKFCIVSYEEVEEVAEGSVIAFYRNGVYQGEAFMDIMRGKYYPAISLYMGASVTCNFGPRFQYPPKNIFKPVSALYDPSRVDKLKIRNTRNQSFVTNKKAKKTLMQAAKMGHGSHTSKNQLPSKPTNQSASGVVTKKRKRSPSGSTHALSPNAPLASNSQSNLDGSSSNTSGHIRTNEKHPPRKKKKVPPASVPPIKTQNQRPVDSSKEAARVVEAKLTTVDSNKREPQAKTIEAPPTVPKVDMTPLSSKSDSISTPQSALKSSSKFASDKQVQKQKKDEVKRPVQAPSTPIRPIAHKELPKREVKFLEDIPPQKQKGSTKKDSNRPRDTAAINERRGLETPTRQMDASNESLAVDSLKSPKSKQISSDQTQYSSSAASIISPDSLQSRVPQVVTTDQVIESMEPANTAFSATPPDQVQAMQELLQRQINTAVSSSHFSLSTQEQKVHDIQRSDQQQTANMIATREDNNSHVNLSKVQSTQFEIPNDRDAEQFHTRGSHTYDTQAQYHSNNFQHTKLPAQPELPQPTYHQNRPSQSKLPHENQHELEMSQVQQVQAKSGLLPTSDQPVQVQSRHFVPQSQHQQHQQHQQQQQQQTITTQQLHSQRQLDTHFYPQSQQDQVVHMASDVEQSNQVGQVLPKTQLQQHKASSQVPSTLQHDHPSISTGIHQYQQPQLQPQTQQPQFQQSPLAQSVQQHILSQASQQTPPIPSYYNQQSTQVSSAQMDVTAVSPTIQFSRNTSYDQNQKPASLLYSSTINIPNSALSSNTTQASVPPSPRFPLPNIERRSSSATEFPFGSNSTNSNPSSHSIMSDNSHFTNKSPLFSLGGRADSSFPPPSSFTSPVVNPTNPISPMTPLTSLNSIRRESLPPISSFGDPMGSHQQTALPPLSSLTNMAPPSQFSWNQATFNNSSNHQQQQPQQPQQPQNR